MFDMAIRDVHGAFPYGRGNVLVRNRDALAGNAGNNPNGINVTESTSKNGLTELGRHLGLASESNSASTQTDQIHVGLQLAASQLLLGSTTCSGYVDALAAASMARLSRIRLPDGGTLQLKVIGHGDGPIRLDDVALDHNICEATFTDKDGMAFPIILDPWADMNTPILKEHSKYQYGDEAIDYSYDDPTVPYQETMAKHMHEASGNLQENLYNVFVELVLEEGDEAIPKPLAPSRALAHLNELKWGKPFHLNPINMGLIAPCFPGMIVSSCTTEQFLQIAACGQLIR
jgi:hypothetical protein